VIITIHQPEHLPYFGFLDKARKADILVLLDDVQFKKNNFQNRNRILTPYGVKWLTIPVSLSGFLDKTIADMETSGDWKEKYRAQVHNAYCKHFFYTEQGKWLDEMLAQESIRLIDYNVFAIRKLFEILDISTSLVFSGELNVASAKSQRLFDICSKCKADAYLAGQGAINYLDETIFENKIKIINHEFVHPIYPQHKQDPFQSHLSILDALMNIGAEGVRQFFHG
jgi:hypothetical protein